MKEQLVSTKNSLSVYESRVISGTTLAPLIFAALGEYLIALGVFIALLIYLKFYFASQIMRKFKRHYDTVTLMNIFVLLLCGILIHEIPELRLFWAVCAIVSFWCYGNYLDKMILEFNKSHENSCIST